MYEYKDKVPLGPYNSPNDVTALRNTTSEQSALAHAEANERMKESLKEPTPQEIQRKIHTENLRNQLNNNRKAKPPWKPLDAPKLVPDPTETDPSIVAIVAAIEAGAPFVILLDDGKQVTLHASKLSQMAILGLMVKFVYQLKTQEINVKGLIDE